MSEELDQYGVVGHPVAHSWSPFIHGMFAKQTGQSLVYRLYDVAPERFNAHVLEFAARGGRGLNVTVPHKLAAAGIARELTRRAQRAGAVNTLTFMDGEIFGDNTDGIGLARDLTDNLGIRVAQKRILIVGAGGAVRGVLGPLAELGPREIVIAGRSAPRAQALAEHFTDLGAVRGCGLEELPPVPFDILINATSASLSGEVPEITAGVVNAGTLCYDMAYAKTETAFSRWALERGCGRAVQGWGMLIEQAAESFAIWRGLRPLTAPVLALLGNGGARAPHSAASAS